MALTLHVKNIGRDLFQGPGYLQDGDVVEFIGEESTGKSSLLQELMITCLLPSSCGGCGSGVIYFDLDNHFDILRIAGIIESKTGASEEDIKLWLKNLYLLRCNSLEEVVVSLHSLTSLIANNKVPFGMIILDSISSFYWVDVRDGGHNQYSREKKMHKVVDILKDLKERYRLCILASTQILMNCDAKQGNSPPYKPYLCRSWQNLVKHQYMLRVHKSNSDHEQCKYIAQALTSCSKTTHFTISERGVVFVKSSE